MARILAAKLYSIYRLQPVFLWVNECQKRYYNILNPAFSATFWARHGKLAMPGPIYTKVLGTERNEKYFSWVLVLQILFYPDSCAIRRHFILDSSLQCKWLLWVRRKRLPIVYESREICFYVKVASINRWDFIDFDWSKLVLGSAHEKSGVWTWSKWDGSELINISNLRQISSKSLQWRNQTEIEVCWRRLLRTM